MSERITWTRCPSCGGPAALGWLDDEPVEYDCPGGCPPLLDGSEGFADELLHVPASSRDLGEQAGWWREQARSACAVHHDGPERRASRQHRATPVDSSS